MLPEERTDRAQSIQYRCKYQFPLFYAQLNHIKPALSQNIWQKYLSNDHKMEEYKNMKLEQKKRKDMNNIPIYLIIKYD